MSSQTLTRDDVIARLLAAAPAGRPAPSGTERMGRAAPSHRRPAGGLRRCRPTGLRRFQDIRSAPSTSIGGTAPGTQRLAILVTGGTGCIGSTLLAELAAARPARLASVSRGVTVTWTSVAGVDYHHADIRDRDRLPEVFDAVRPDIVYHLAAQHDPGLAELEVARTLSTNVTGTANVIAACLPHASRLDPRLHRQGPASVQQRHLRGIEEARGMAAHAGHGGRSTGRGRRPIHPRCRQLDHL